MTERASVLLIDEFENGLQHDAIGPVWSALGQFARDNDVQIFATTHSYECIAAAHEAFSDNAEDFAVIKLRPEPNSDISAVVLDSDAVGAALKTELEIR
ncbi:MAG: AAA family ATPase, partial [Kiritimatiellae bacterium]|nr:AAA family ATPase [Kiritimatiellia bacterium]